MTTNGARIPRGLNDFNSYITNTSTYMADGTPITNGERTGLLPEEITTWTGFKTRWVPLFLLYMDKKNTRTTSVIDQMRAIIDETVTFDQTAHILDRIAASPNANIVDMEVFNIKSGILQKSSRSVSSSAITEPVTVTLLPLGGGTMQVKCYSSTGQRSSIYTDADSVQFVYQVDSTPPASAEEPGLTKDLSTKATFSLALGSRSSAKNLYIYFRWYNTKHPENAGPWSAMQTTLIL